MPSAIDPRDVHSEEVQEIIGRVPSWIVRMGTVVIACLSLLLIVGAWLIRYPEVVSAHVVMSATQPPVRMHAQTGGQVMEQEVENGDHVVMNQIIGFIGDTGKDRVLFRLTCLVDSLERTVAALPRSPGFARADHPWKREGRQDHRGLEKARQAYGSLLLQDLSPSDGQSEGLTGAYAEEIRKLKDQHQQWETKHVLRAPIDGKLVFYNLWETDKYVVEGAPVFMVLPAVVEYEVWAQLPIGNMGKVRKGQKVLIRLDEYPSMEYGALTGQVSSLSGVTLDGNYTLKIKVEDGVQALQHRNIELLPRITGTADIITKDRSLLQRIFNLNQ